MATVPRYDLPQVAANTLPQARFDSGPGVVPVQDIAGQQARQMGDSMTNFGQHVSAIALHMQNEARATVAKDVDTQVTAATSDALYDPEKGFMGKLGKGVVDGYDAAIDNVKAIHERALNGVTDPAVRAMVKPVLDARMQHTL